MMKRAFSLAHLTVLNLPPPELIRVAARTGYAHVGLRLIATTDTTPGYPLMRDPVMMRATKAALRETAVTVLDIEFVRITPELEIAALEPFLAAGAELGAKYVITAPYDPDLARLADRLAAIADLSVPLGLCPVLEFFPWTVVPDLGTAWRVVQTAERPRVGILVDTLHFDRSASTLDELDRIPSSRFPFVHVADAPVLASYTMQDLLHAGRCERLPPGEGGIDIIRILRHMPPGIPVALEIPMTSLTLSVGPEEIARRALNAATKLLGADQS
jgi:sugar phosphate isomerase/epimerase